MSKSDVGGHDVILLFQEYAELDWARTTSRIAKIWTGEKVVLEDQPTRPPFISFRFRDGNDALTNVIVEAVESFDGRLAWCVIHHDRSPLSGINRAICPKKAAEAAADAAEAGMSLDEYCALHMPDLGPLAHDDIPDLLAHLRDCIESRGISRLEQGE